MPVIQFFVGTKDNAMFENLFRMDKSFGTRSLTEMHAMSFGLLPVSRQSECVYFKGI